MEELLTYQEKAESMEKMPRTPIDVKVVGYTTPKITREEPYLLDEMGGFHKK